MTTTHVPAFSQSVNQDGVMAQLKASTTQLHQHAESRPLQRAMAKGILAREIFIAYLGQLLLVHETLESNLRMLRQAQPRLAPVFQDDQQRVPNLRADLAHFNLDPAGIKPAAATQSLIDQVDRLAGAAPIGLLGMLYVLEGSNNGSKYIARAISRAIGVAPGQPGLSYLDPYGDQQMPRWQAFKRDMDAVGFTQPEIEASVAGAKAMFNGIAEISDEQDKKPA